MKRILITGANSYIGTSFEKWMKQYDGYVVDTVDMVGDGWKEKDFSGYDVILHVAGIAHIKETKENANLYYDVNRDLTIATAEKAKMSGVKTFVLLSSMSVYGMLTGSVDETTIPNPTTHYGKSKLEADMALDKMSDENFLVAIVRPPMVYGEGCKGNYSTLSEFAKKTPIFIKTNNKRSMIYIYNLCEFIYQIIIHNKSGLFWPQNKQYVSTDEMVKKIANLHNRKVMLIKGVGSFLKLLHIKQLDKILGDLVYKYQDYGFEYQVADFEQSIEESESR